MHLRFTSARPVRSSRHCISLAATPVPVALAARGTPRVVLEFGFRPEPSPAQSRDRRALPIIISPAADGSRAARAPDSAKSVAVRRAGGPTPSHESGWGIDAFAAQPDRVHHAGNLDCAVSHWNTRPKPQPSAAWWSPLLDLGPYQDREWATPSAIRAGGTAATGRPITAGVRDAASRSASLQLPMYWICGATHMVYCGV